MLVLSRKPGERILVGADIKLTVIRIGPNSVRIGIDAPQGVNIVREELTFEQSLEELRSWKGADNRPLSAGELVKVNGLLDLQRH